MKKNFISILLLTLISVPAIAGWWSKELTFVNKTDREIFIYFLNYPHLAKNIITLNLFDDGGQLALRLKPNEMGSVKPRENVNAICVRDDSMYGYSTIWSGRTTEYQTVWSRAIAKRKGFAEVTKVNDKYRLQWIK